FISNIHFVDNQNVSFKINNIKLNDITGNNNNLADFGEKISTFINIKNEGNIKAGKLKTLIFSENKFIKVLENKAFIDSIPAGDTASVKIPFYIEIDSLVDNNYAALMRLEITGNDSITKHLYFSIILHSPAFKILSFNITDTNSINSNERLEPDKYFFLKIKVANLSITDAKDTKTILVTDNKDVKIDNNNYNLGLLSAGQEATALFKIYINKSVVSGSVIEFKFKIILGSYYSQQTFIKFAGRANENFESSDFLKFNWDTVSTYPWLITNNSVFEGNYSARSGLIQSKNYSPLSISFNVSENDSISFYLKTVSSSSDNYLSFYIDDDLIITVKGQNNWQRYSYPVYTGYRTFKWQYTIINSADPLTDYACLDYISFPVSIDVLSAKFAASSNKFHFQFTNFPNPADIYTDIRFDLQKPSRLNIEITDIFGRLCYSSNYLHFNKGANVFRINTADFNEGLYLIRFTFDNKINYSRLIILH
nr:T9SS type A sorting domain-containing protein [Bacteroidales bacterium]